MLHRPDGHSVIPGVVVHVRVRRIEVQVVSIRGIIERSGPVVAVRAKILKRSTIVVACGWQRCLRRIEHYGMMCRLLPDTTIMMEY